MIPFESYCPLLVLDLALIELYFLQEGHFASLFLPLLDAAIEYHRLVLE